MKLLMLFLAVILCVTPACATETYDMDTDYAELMIAAAMIGDTEAGRKYENLRNQKKEALGIEDSLTYDDLFLLAKIVENEAGSIWLSEDHRKCVASVVMKSIKIPISIKIEAFADVEDFIFLDLVIDSDGNLILPIILPLLCNSKIQRNMDIIKWMRRIKGFVNPCIIS